MSGTRFSLFCIVPVLSLVVAGTSTSARASCGDYLHNNERQSRNDATPTKSHADEAGDRNRAPDDAAPRPRRCDGPRCNGAPAQPLQPESTTVNRRSPQQTATLPPPGVARTSARVSTGRKESAADRRGFPSRVDRPPEPAA